MGNCYLNERTRWTWSERPANLEQVMLLACPFSFALWSLVAAKCRLQLVRSSQLDDQSSTTKIVKAPYSACMEVGVVLDLEGEKSAASFQHLQVSKLEIGSKASETLTPPSLQRCCNSGSLDCFTDRSVTLPTVSPSFLGLSPFGTGSPFILTWVSNWFFIMFSNSWAGT
ncbi:hypothetical protein F2Q68_00039015 [Brassica cretica]|uniref:Uncharacterized protein n=1 Tax=Brassica cretica TaxID=69181 RepID=A0A8S9MNH4_BRACR|nr:hypothetical protein F2Q68_00039015 [Brassica cretica]